MMEKEIMEGSKNGRQWSKRRDSNPRPRDPKQMPKDFLHYFRLFCALSATFHLLSVTL